MIRPPVEDLDELIDGGYFDVEQHSVVERSGDFLEADRIAPTLSPGRSRGFEGAEASSNFRESQWWMYEDQGRTHLEGRFGKLGSSNEVRLWQCASSALCVNANEADFGVRFSPPLTPYSFTYRHPASIKLSYSLGPKGLSKGEGGRTSVSGLIGVSLYPKAALSAGVVGTASVTKGNLTVERSIRFEGEIYPNEVGAAAVGVFLGGYESALSQLGRANYAMERWIIDWYRYPR